MRLPALRLPGDIVSLTFTDPFPFSRAANALGSTGELFHLLGGVSAKHAKSIGAVLGPLQDALVKHSKKVAKLARTLETSLAEREAKVRKSAGGLERSLGRAGGGAGSGAGWMGGGGGGGSGAVGKEDRLLSTLRALGEEINNAKECGFHLNLLFATSSS